MGVRGKKVAKGRESIGQASSGGDEPPVDLSAVIRAVNKLNPGSGARLTLGSSDDLESVPRYRFSSGVSVLDVVFSGGLPTGRMIEVYGPESSGKSTLAIQAAAACQRAGGIVYLIDHEGSLDRERAVGFGVDMERFTGIQAPTCEDAFEKIRDTLKVQADLSGGACRFPTLIIWDTIAAAQTKKEQQAVKWGEGKEVGGKSRVIHEGFRTLQPVLANYNACMLFLNQVRTEIGGYSPHGPKLISTGGWAMRHFPSARIMLTSIGSLYEPILDGDGSPRKLDKRDRGLMVGIACRFKVVKNKLSRPGSTFVVPLYFDRGFDDRETILQVLRRAGTVSQSGAWFRFQTPLKEEHARVVAGPGVTVGKEDGETFIRFQGEGKWVEILDRFPALLPVVRELVKQNWKYI